MPTSRYLIATFLISCMTLLEPPAGSGQTLSVTLGGRFIGESYAPVGNQPELALGYAYQPSTWPLGVEAYLAGSYGDRTTTVWPPYSDFMPGKLRVITIETGVGIRKEWRGRGARPDIDAGLAYARVQAQERTSGWRGPYDRYDGFGPWAGAGVTWPLGVSTRLGFAGRYSSIETKESWMPGGGTHLGLTLAWTPDAKRER